ncbi:NmrA/HSCARG family protein [Stigmatella sp. ncwal1]|uniref:NmrA/HSCARG family protein n=1 Tax=Stigmatella ashevillensis TaxID=2995309 RepID=A0ABT5DG61_9BACT|nr:NmrA/HSCARG family protein [Stigmatella ashevillena]MDC0712598.1 NmrA/HSCARG family protein [Stigmatella ashevillena]
MDSLLSVLVTGATGQQGGALARQLLDRGHHVVALTRDTDSPAARALHKRGAELVMGDFDDMHTLEKAARGVTSVYAMSTPFEQGTEAEVRHGAHLVDAARRAGVKHFVYSSVAGADHLTGIPHFDSKHEVEHYLRHSRVPYTILGPTFFMENFTGPMFREGLASGILAMGLPPSRGLQMVSLEDLAAFTVQVFSDPEEFIGQRIDVASDEVTGQQATDLLSYASGHRLHYQQLPLDFLQERSDDMARMYAWLDRVGYHSDILTLRHAYPALGWHTFEEWSRGQDWSFLSGVPRAAGLMEADDQPLPH